jgi:hypothetical protein
MILHVHQSHVYSLDVSQYFLAICDGRLELWDLVGGIGPFDIE